MSYYDVNIKDFGIGLRKIRISKGLSQDDLESRCGSYKYYISNIENGKGNPSLKTISSILESLDMTMQDFYNELNQEV